MEHKYSTYALMFIFFSMIVISIGTAINSDDLDEFGCGDGTLLKRISGVWQCSKTAFGEMVITTDTTISIPLNNQYYTITGLTIEHGQNIASDNNSYFNIIKAGNYKIDVRTSFGGGGNTEYEMELFVNSQPHNHCELHRKMGTNGDVGSASLACYEVLSIGDNLSIGVADNTNPSQDINIHHMNFMIEEIQ